MTRDLEILQAAQMCARNYGGENLVELAFKKGAEWADAHQPSPWISVEDRLPEEEDNPDEYNAPHRTRSSRNVIITDGVIVNSGKTRQELSKSPRNRKSTNSSAGSAKCHVIRSLSLTERPKRLSLPIYTVSVYWTQVQAIQTTKQR